MPITTAMGQPSGHEIGQRVTHCIEEGGAFAYTCSGFMTTDNANPVQDGATRKEKAASKAKYTCPECGLNAWAKPAAPLGGRDCGQKMQPEPDEDD
jgi:hypothetical protein